MIILSDMREADKAPELTNRHKELMAWVEERFQTDGKVVYEEVKRICLAMVKDAAKDFPDSNESAIVIEYFILRLASFNSLNLINFVAVDGHYLERAARLSTYVVDNAMAAEAKIEQAYYEAQGATKQ